MLPKGSKTDPPAPPGVAAPPPRATAPLAPPAAGSTTEPAREPSLPPPPNLAALADRLLGDAQGAANHAAKALAEILESHPETAAPIVDRFVKGLVAENKRVAQTCADALPAIARAHPARVAKHMDALRDAYARCSAIGKDGIVRAFATLCQASVAYQKRLEPTLSLALSEAEPKTLQIWSELVLPALKGEPHASARAVVQGRLSDLPRPIAQKIADQLGIKLRPRPSP